MDERTVERRGQWNKLTVKHSFEEEQQLDSFFGRDKDVKSTPEAELSSDADGGRIWENKKFWASSRRSILERETMDILELWDRICWVEGERERERPAKRVANLGNHDGDW